MATIAVQPDHIVLKRKRHVSFSERWIQRLQAQDHQARVVDLFRPDLFEQLAGCDGLMWWYPPDPFPRNFAVRLLSAIDHGMGLPVFPDYRTCWHFDDKVAQFYLLRAAGIPMPRTWVFWQREQAIEFCRSASYPLVLKLAGGIMSANVRLLRDVAEAEYWVGKLFGRGVFVLQRPTRRLPEALVRSAASTLEHLVTGRPRRLPRGRDWQHGYFLVQEFLEGNHYDTRVAVIGNRAFGFRRFNRPADFRASGSGLRSSDPTKIDPAFVRLAFRVAQCLGTQSIAVDGLWRGGTPVLTE